MIKWLKAWFSPLQYRQSNKTAKYEVSLGYQNGHKDIAECDSSLPYF